MSKLNSDLPEPPPVFKISRLIPPPEKSSVSEAVIPDEFSSSISVPVKPVFTEDVYGNISTRTTLPPQESAFIPPANTTLGSMSSLDTKPDLNIPEVLDTETVKSMKSVSPQTKQILTIDTPNSNLLDASTSIPL